MPSNAYTEHLLVLLRDADELIEAHKKLCTGKVGRQYGLGALNRAVMVMCASAWEAYLEQLVRECLAALKPASGAMGTWSSLNASAQGLLGRFNNPDVEQVRALLADTLGLYDVTDQWSWHKCTSGEARARLKQAMKYRHSTAHGVKPRPVIHSHYSSRLPGFFRRLGHCTDTAVRAHVVQVLGVPNPWP